MRASSSRSSRDRRKRASRRRCGIRSGDLADHSSLPGLTRQSISLRKKPLFRRGWITGSPVYAKASPGLQVLVRRSPSEGGSPVMTVCAEFRKLISEIRKLGLPPDPNQLYMFGRPVPLEGRFAIVTSAGRDAVDADGASDEGADCGRRSRVVLTPQRLASSPRRQLRRRGCQQSTLTGE